MTYFRCSIDKHSCNTGQIIRSIIKPTIEPFVEISMPSLKDILVAENAVSTDNEFAISTAPLKHEKALPRLKPDLVSKQQSKLRFEFSASISLQFTAIEIIIAQE